ncbi:hypothetical protein [Streptomyces sp. NPDC002209]|uniref:hypothetical protein n=1 Tax=Streptomyces sp. NPDC002209 TaxID=3364638 RepID=UPI00369BC48F
MRAVDRLYVDADRGPAEAAYNNLAHAFAGVDLVAQSGLEMQASRVVSTAESLANLAQDRAEAARAKAVLDSVSQFDPAYAAVRRARLALAELRRSYVEDDEDLNRANHPIASTALGQIPGLSQEQVNRLLLDTQFPELAPERARCREAHGEAFYELIAQARTVLGIRS